MTVKHRFPDPILPIWEQFIDGKTDATGMRSTVIHSWRRCRDLGLNPYDDSPHQKIQQGLLEKLIQSKQELISTAKPIMSSLYEFVQGSGFVVVLTDEQGRIIELFSDDAENNPLVRDFFPGAVWREEAAGTNAIGTAAILHAPVQISGAEHYCQKYHLLTCSAAPIMDRRQEIIGILDISGESHMSHLHTLGMVVAAAAAITSQLDIRAKNKELAVMNGRLTNIFNTISDGVLMVDTQGILLQINPAAQEILGKTANEFLGRSMDQLLQNNAAVARRTFSLKDRFADVELIVDNNLSKFHCLASGEPILDECGAIIGSVIVLRPIKQIQNLVNRFSGYRATLQFDDIIGESPEILESKRMASFAATTSSNILLQGESGTGKEIFAQAIHNLSEQKKGPFVALNCGIIPRELIGSELFGYAEGAFTGAKREGKPGKLEFASGGTLFLDEIGDMPLEQQVALLRVMEERKVTRIGSNNLIPVNVRFICATNKNLLQQVEKGLFRQDLYYRLNVISIILPPLRNRIRDISLLFRHYFEKLCRDRAREFFVEPAVLMALQQYAWPGNVRELQNVVERAVSLSDSHILSMAHLPQEIQSATGPEGRTPEDGTASSVNSRDFRRQQRRQLQEDERLRMFAILSQCGGNVSAAARKLGISRITFYRKMRQNDEDSGRE